MIMLTLLFLFPLLAQAQEKLPEIKVDCSYIPGTKEVPLLSKPNGSKTTTIFCGTPVKILPKYEKDEFMEIDELTDLGLSFFIGGSILRGLQDVPVVVLFQSKMIFSQK